MNDGIGEPLIDQAEGRSCIQKRIWLLVVQDAVQLSAQPVPVNFIHCNPYLLHYTIGLVIAKGHIIGAAIIYL